MGEQHVQEEVDTQELRIFMQRLLDDVRVLDRMLEADELESGVVRIGAEQELFLIDESQRPSPTGPQVLEAIGDPHFTTELARFNLECNLDPLPLEGDCFGRLEDQLQEMLALARSAASEVGAQVLLTGILPTLDKADLGLDNMTPVPRYFALAEALRRQRGREFAFHIKGRDELSVRHDSVMMEACNTSFQVHLQVDPGRFARLYNLTQLLTAPVLAAATFSPTLFGKRLWSETRIALFQQAVDTRGASSHLRHQQARVSFGERWVDRSVLEIFREDIARFRLLLSRDLEDEDVAEGGGPPKLSALRLHNGTVYRWNRPCYGISDGKPHLRIENRILPSGPTVVDEVANAAFWLGLMRGADEEYGEVASLLPFDAVKENFLAAARLGLKSQLRWIGGRQRPARELILGELLPLARQGLKAYGVDERGLGYLDLLEARVHRGQTGSQWVLDSLEALDGRGSVTERMTHLTAETLRHQEEGTPVHAWPLASRLPGNPVRKLLRGQIRSLMTTDLFTVHQDEVLDLVASIMDWRHIRHVPVEDSDQRLVGIVTHRGLLREMARRYGQERKPIAVREIMQKDVVTVGPDTPALDAVRLLEGHRIGCLPVIEEGRLVGIVTERDFLRVAGQLLKEMLESEAKGD